MKIFGKKLFLKKKSPSLDNEQISTVGITSFYTLRDGTTYNPDVIDTSTYLKISEHYQVSAALAVIRYSIQQIDWFIDTEDETTRAVLTLAIEKIWNKLIRSISKSFVYGYSPNVKVFTLKKIKGKNYVIYKKIRDVNPKDCDVKVNKWGNFNGFIYRKGTLQEKYISPDISFWYVNNEENGNMYGKSMLKKIYKPWWRSEKIHDFSDRYYERFGEPLVIGRAPTAAKVKDSTGKIRTAQELMTDVIGSIRSHSSVQLPSDRDTENKEYEYDLKYLESQMRGFDFENYLKRLDMEIARGLFLPELIFGGSTGGSYSLGSAQIEVFYTNLMGIMNNIVDYVNLYLLPQLIEYNFKKDEIAKFNYQPLSSEQKKNINTMILALIKGNKIKPETKQLEDISGIKFEEIKNVDKSEVDIKKEIKKETKEIILKDKEKKLDKKIEEVDSIKKELTNLYLDE